jgi:hypothetical protein
MKQLLTNLDHPVRIMGATETSESEESAQKLVSARESGAAS